MKRRFVVLAAVGAVVAATLATAGSAATARTVGASDAVSASSASPSENAVRKTSNVIYQVDADGTVHRLTVYAPVGGGGPWPSAVMIHGAGLTLDNWARAVAGRGFVVFVPYWPINDESFSSGQHFYAEANGIRQRMACAVRFARANSVGFGGDRSYLSLFGFSAGANYAAQVAPGSAPAAPGCVTRTGSTRPDNAVLFEGDWMLVGDLVWNDMLAQEPRIMDILTPWSGLPDDQQLPVHILDSGDPGLTTMNIGWTSEDEWLPLRDPTGSLRLRQGLERRDAFADGDVTEREVQLVLYDRMRHFGFDVTFGDLPNSCHCSGAFDDDAALQMLLDAMLANK